MRTPAAWAQVTWKDVEQCSHEHWMQAPDTFFMRFRQYTHFWGDSSRGNGAGSLPGKALGIQGGKAAAPAVGEAEARGAKPAEHRVVAGGLALGGESPKPSQGPPWETLVDSFPQALSAGLPRTGTEEPATCTSLSRPSEAPTRRPGDGP